MAALANFSSRFVFAWFVGFELSVLLAFFVGLTTAFTLNRAFVFHGERRTTWRTEALRFLAVNLMGLAITMTAAVASLRAIVAIMGPSVYAEGLAHLIGLSSTAVTSYLGHKYWTFGGAAHDPERG